MPRVFILWPWMLVAHGAFEFGTTFCVCRPMWDARERRLHVPVEISCFWFFRFLRLAAAAGSSVRCPSTQLSHPPAMSIKTPFDVAVSRRATPSDDRPRLAARERANGRNPPFENGLRGHPAAAARTTELTSVCPVIVRVSFPLPSGRSLSSRSRTARLSVRPRQACRAIGFLQLQQQQQQELTSPLA